MIVTNRTFIPTALGIALGAAGAIIVGYLAAFYTPADFFIWFDQHGMFGLARLLIALSVQLIGFGILAILIGRILGKTKHWLSSSLVCYLSMISYIAILDGKLPFRPLTIESLTFGLVALLCLLASAYVSYKKHNKKLASFLDLSSTLAKQG